MTARSSRHTRHLRPQDLAGLRWRGLVRESTREQAERWSPDAQRRDMVRAAEGLGMTGGDRWYDRTGSGEEHAVPELQEALADAKRGEYDVLVCFATSRFARDRAEAVTMKRAFREAGVIIYFVAERLISGTYGGSLQEGISEVIDEHANEERRLYIAGGLRERELSGQWVGRVPTGYRLRMKEMPDRTVRPDGGLEVDPETAPLVERIFRERIAGVGLRPLVRKLNREGSRNARGALWHPRHVRDILANPVYKGVLARYRRRLDYYWPKDDPENGGYERPGDWPAIISPDDWAKAQLLAGDRFDRAPRRSYPLSGVLRCWACDRRMTGVTNARGRRYYRCPGRSLHGICDGPSIHADHAEATFGEFLGFLHPWPEWERQRTERRAPDGRTLQAKKERLTAQLVRLRELYEWGDLPAAEYKARSAEIKEALAETVTPVDEKALESWYRMSDRWDEVENDPVERRAIVMATLAWMKLPPDRNSQPLMGVHPHLAPILEELRVQDASDVSEAANLYLVGSEYAVRITA